MTRKQSAVEASLLRKGFRQEETHPHFSVYYTLAGLKSRLRTRTSHGGRDLDEYLLHQMAKQCGLAKRDFIDLVDCPLDQAGYEEKVAGKL